MGEYAEYALADAMRRGFGCSGMASPKGRGRRKKCSLCARGIGGGHMGMVSHLREGHKLPREEAYKIAATPTTPSGEPS
jgi:hypothetical protein